MRIKTPQRVRCGRKRRPHLQRAPRCCRWCYLFAFCSQVSLVSSIHKAAIDPLVSCPHVISKSTGLSLCWMVVCLFCLTFLMSRHRWHPAVGKVVDETGLCLLHHHRQHTAEGRWQTPFQLEIGIFIIWSGLTQYTSISVVFVVFGTYYVSTYLKCELYKGQNFVCLLLQDL